MKPSLISISLVTALSCAAFALEASARTAQIDTHHAKAAQVAFTDAHPANPPHLMAFTDAHPANPPHLMAFTDAHPANPPHLV